MAEKENNQRHESTIDKYFTQTAKAYETWAEENKEGRNFLQIAVEYTGDVVENGRPVYDFLVSYAGNTKILADGIYQNMKDDKFIRTLVITAVRKFFMNK